MTKVLYLICSSHKKAGGGHFYSMNTLIEGLRDINYQILNIGLVFAKNLSINPKASYIPLYKYNFIFYIIQVLRFVKSYSPDVMHAFDQRSLFVARCCSILLNIPVVYTKCGGRNGSDFIPYADTSILFSKENLDHFLRNRKFIDPYFLIPNRANLTQPDTIRINELNKKYDLKKSLVVLRISRFNEYYDRTFRQSISLLKELLKVDASVKLLFIGKIQSEAYFKSLALEVRDLPVTLITDDQFTKNASSLIPLADMVIATGRGVMEASSFGKLIFCPVQGSSLPVPLNETTVEELFNKNFSERAVFDAQSMFSPISSILENKIVFEKYSQQLFHNRFSINSVIDSYLNLYESMTSRKIMSFNFALQALWFFKPKLN